MPDARLHFRSPAWQSLPVAGLPPATSPESAQPTPAFFRLHRSHRLGVGEAYEGPARRLPAAERQSRRLSGDRQVTAGGRAKARRLRTGRGETHPRVPAAGWPRHPHCRPDLAGRDCRRRSNTGSLLPFEPCDSLRAEIPRHRISGDCNRDLRLSTRCSRKCRRGSSLLASRRAALARTGGLRLLRQGDARRLSRGARLTTEMRYSSCLPFSSFSAFALSH